MHDLRVIDRREFLGAAMALGCGVAMAQSAGAKVKSKARLIDVHHHVLPDFWKTATATATPWTLEGSLAAMDKNGVATSICSITAPGAWVGDVQRGRTLARQCNEYMAQIAKDHPGRFGMFASIPLPDSEGSLAEIAYAMDVLKADGIGLITNYNDKWPGDDSYAPVLEELHRRKAVVYFHPGAASCCGNLVPNVRPQIAEYPHDSTRALLSLLVSGSLVKYRDIRFIFSHGGGTIPYLAGRITQMTRQQKNLPQVAPQGVEYELKRLYYEIANSSSAPSMAALMKLVPLGQILFGSDYPFVPIEETADGMVALKLPPASVAAIFRGNAGKLLPRWKA